MRTKKWMSKRRFSIKGRLEKILKCIRSGEQLRVDEVPHSSDSLATRDYSASGGTGCSTRTGEVETKVDNSNIEEAESSLRESGYLNYEEARALLGRLEYQKGNTEAALHVFEGIDIAGVIPKMKVSISRGCETNRRCSQSDSVPPMSMHAVSLLLEAIFLKAKSLQGLGRLGEAAQSCKLILDTVESALPDGLPENFASDCKLQETVGKAVELLPELWILAGAPQEAILSYRQALLYRWNLDIELASKMEKEFAVFLLYSGCDANPPNLCSQMESSFVPRNNIEEAILLLLVLLGKFVAGTIEWDPSILDHLSFALSISGKVRALAHQVEELIPGIMGRQERYCTLALCYYGEEHAEQRKLDIALYYAKQLLKLEAGSSVKSYALLAQILSAQKRFIDAETVINAALDQTGKWDQGELLRTKAKLHIAQGQLKNAIETYTNLLAVLQVRTKNLGVDKRLLKSRRNHNRSLEMETWHDLANLYTSLSQWRDAEVCLSKSQSINPHSASRWHSTENLKRVKSHSLLLLGGLLYEAKGLQQEALESFRKALDVEPTHVPSLISAACILRQFGGQSLPVARSFLMDALRLDRGNPCAWYNLGLLYKADARASMLETAECFEAAAFFEEHAPIEPFR
ncbi:protein NPGR2-like isoform X3 [Malus sylvestris]|uniref:protein NPGR2-like isoform X3 n=1 Tax=Malus sylvestris TaxID=3752 RepID=UPI0021AC1DDA|nr:protein NPGR2-like isoform X3 [Malus sylvestris]